MTSFEVFREYDDEPEVKEKTRTKETPEKLEKEKTGERTQEGLEAKESPPHKELTLEEAQEPKTKEQPEHDLEKPFRELEELRQTLIEALESLPQSITKEQLQEDFRRYDLTDSESPILRAADNPELRKTLLPLPGSQLFDVAGDLLSLVENTSDPTFFTRIQDYETYLEALQAFPLIQLHPQFDELHHQAKLHFQFRSIIDSGIEIKFGVFKEYTGLSQESRDTWLQGKPPRIVGMLERRAKYAANIRRGDYFEETYPVFTIEEVKQRINSFALKQHITSHQNYPQWIRQAEQHLLIRQLARTGYYTGDLSHYQVEGWNAEVNFRKALRWRPYLVHFVTHIPDAPPKPGQYWLPVDTIGQRGFQWLTQCNWIQVPLRITNQEQVDRVLNQLEHPNYSNLKPAPANHPISEKLQGFGMDSEIYEEWKGKFGFLDTPEERRLAFAYLIGTTLSDGFITKRKHMAISSYWRITLSSRMKSGEPALWSKDFGDRASYYWTRFGVFTRRVEDTPASDEKSLKYNWESCYTPFLTWFNEAVLCLPQGGNHTNNLSEADWIFRTDRDFRIKVIQGICDGDGWVVTGHRIAFGTSAQRQGPFIEPLFQSLGFKTCRIRLPSNQDERLEVESGFDIRIHDKRQLRLLSEMPPFLSATRKQELLEKGVRMNESTLSSGGNSRFDLPLTRLIQRRGKEGWRTAKIREEIFERCGVTLTVGVIRKIIKQGPERLRIDEKVVEAYTQLLKLRISFPQETISSHCQKVMKETSHRGHLQTYVGWVRGRRVPLAVQRAISDNHPLVDKELLEAYPHLRKFKSLLDNGDE
ncbi:MAG: hypothetical protein ACFFCO_00650 [Promethearchaeota archaeon]